MSMDGNRYAIMKTLSNGRPMQVSDVPTIIEGKQKLRELGGQDWNSEYFMFDLREFRRVASIADNILKAMA